MTDHIFRLIATLAIVTAIVSLVSCGDLKNNPQTNPDNTNFSQVISDDFSNSKNKGTFYDAENNVFITPYFRWELPREWHGKFAYEISGNDAETSISLYELPDYDRYKEAPEDYWYPGFIANLSISEQLPEEVVENTSGVVTKREWYNAGSYVLGTVKCENEKLLYLLYTEPTDVQFDSEDEEAAQNYMLIFERVGETVTNLKAEDDCSITIFPASQ